MEALPASIYSTADVRAIDARAIAGTGAGQGAGIAGYTLMTRAGESALANLRAQWPIHRRLLVLCGRGNNGGDGYVVARFARASGLDVVVSAPAGVPDGGDALRAYQDWRAAGGTLADWSSDLLANADVVVDALLGTGLDRDVDARLGEVIDAVNAARLPIVALDVPSGLDADTGLPRGRAIRATLTVTFVAPKTGFFLGVGPEHVGRVVCDDLDIPADAYAGATPRLRRVTEKELRAALPRRARTAHKGSNGRVLVVGGGAGMPGAVRLAGEAALRSGAGLVTVATWPGHAATIAVGRPELICVGVESAGALTPLLDAADVVAIGPGLGRDTWARSLVAAAFASNAPLVVDADALNLLAESPGRRERWCLTPHPGEAARLLGIGADAVQADRLGAVGRIAARYGGVAVLKGAGTLVAADGAVPWVCERGNPGMAAAGMGDVLTGVIAAIAAQQPAPETALELAAAVGVLVHASAGDLAARGGERGILASDVTAHLPACVNPAT
jgi:NAD(P)H-hydrate epimerase